MIIRKVKKLINVIVDKGCISWSVTTDNSSSVYITGETSGGLEGNTHSGYTNCGGTCPDMFLIKFNSDGVLH